MSTLKQFRENRCVMCDAGIPTIRRHRIPHLLDEQTGYNVAVGSKLYTMMVTELDGVAEHFAIRSDTLELQEVVFFRREKTFTVTLQKCIDRSHSNNTQPPTIRWIE